jgi:hypothetical protein
MGFLIFGGFIFWSAVGIICLLLLLTVESYSKSDEIHKGELGWPTFIIMATISLLYSFSNKDQLWQSLKENTSGLLMWFGVYLIIGIVWSFFKWFKTVKYAKGKFLKAKADYENSVNNGYKSATLKSITYFLPKVNQWKASITSWILFWPFSILRYAFGTMLIDFMDAVISRLKGLYDSITCKVAGIDKSELEK